MDCPQSGRENSASPQKKRRERRKEKKNSLGEEKRLKKKDLGFQNKAQDYYSLSLSFLSLPKKVLYTLRKGETKEIRKTEPVLILLLFFFLCYFPN